MSYRNASIEAEPNYQVQAPRARFVRRVKHFVQVRGWAVDELQNVAPRVRIRIGRMVLWPNRTPRPDIRREIDRRGGVSPAQPGFELKFVAPFGISRMRVELEDHSGHWKSIFKTLLVRLSPLDRLPSGRLSYEQWLKSEDGSINADRKTIEVEISNMPVKTQFIVVIDARLNHANMARTFKSVRSQLYKTFDVYVWAASQTAMHMGADTGIVSHLSPFSIADQNSFLIFVKCGDTLSPIALYKFAQTLCADPELDLVYSDEDSLDEQGSRVRPFFKPAWSPDYLESFNYIGHAACFRARVAMQNFQEHFYDFVLRFTECTQSIRHIPAVLYHSMPADKFQTQTIERDIASLQGRLQRTGRIATVQPVAPDTTAYTFRPALSRLPLVSIIVPAAGRTVALNGRPIDLLFNCISSIVQNSTYKNYEIIIIDDGNLSLATLAQLTPFKCTFQTFVDRTFNFSKKINIGAAIANGTILTILNDDVQITTPDWMEKMLFHFEKTHVGVVGPKLLYLDGSIQHVGIVHVQGQPQHVNRFSPGSDHGYFHSSEVSRNFLAVTGACIMTPAAIYRDLGRFNEQFPDDYNDVDYCLKVIGQGYSIVCAADVKLIHLELQSRSGTISLSKQNRFMKTWSTLTIPDPFFNERAFSIEPPTFDVSLEPQAI